MPPANLSNLCKEWRAGLFSTLCWSRDPANALLPGEAGGYRVKADGFPYGGYLKPVQPCGDHHRRAANEKIVADLAHELGFNVPPVLLHQRTDALLGEETNCCVSLIMYAEQYEWGVMWDLSNYPPFVATLVKEALSRYSASYALDLWIGQTDRNNARNVILGVEPDTPVRTEFLFLDHSNSLNIGNRWEGGRGNQIEIVPLPDIFKNSLDKALVLEGVRQIAHMPDDVVRAIVGRMPDSYMSGPQRSLVETTLIARKPLIEDFVLRNL